MLVGTVFLSFKDSKNKVSHTQVRIPNTFTFAQYKAFGLAAAQVFANMSTAEITEVSVGLGLDLSGLGLRTVATQFADWFNKAFVQAINAVSGLVAKFNIPTYDDANNSTGSKNLDPTDTEVAALLTLIEDGLDVGGTIIHPVTVRDEAVDLITIAEETFRES